MALSKAERDKLPASDFAVPGKRQLPIHDEEHTRLAWSQVGRTEGLSEEERAEAKRRIIERAHHFGIDTTTWEGIKAGSVTGFNLSAMSLKVPEVDDHPNRMPFSGILTRIGKPSDAPPHGSDNKQIIISKKAAKDGLKSLLGMAVNYVPDFSGHDSQAKIGIITAATVEGDAIHIDGFIYAADFPKIAAEIKKNKDLLGFSYEATDVYVESVDTDPVVVTSCIFTGAAILLKTKAAYTTTSIAASAAGDFDMDEATLKKILGETLAPVNKAIEDLQAGQAKIDKDLQAGKELHAKVKPHAEAIRACANGMEAAGMGMDSKQGHVAVLKRMADKMEAEAMIGHMPHIFRDHDYMGGSYASADAPAGATKEDSLEVKALKDSVAALTTKVSDLSAATKPVAAEPERKTLSPQIGTLIAKAGIVLPDGKDAKLTAAAVDKAFEGSSMEPRQRLEIKLSLQKAGLLENA